MKQLPLGDASMFDASGASTPSRQRFRFGSGYQLIPFGRLDAETEGALSNLQYGQGAYGILRPIGTQGTIKVVDKEAALVLLTLSEPGPLPSFVFETEDATSWRSQIAVWVADSVLEVFDGKSYLSGPAAHHLLMQKPRRERECGALGHLSRDALRYAAGLEMSDPDALADRLYAFHRLPLGSPWGRRLADQRMVLEFLGISDPNRILPGWRHEDPASAIWLGWQRAARPGPRSPSRPTWKLYLSPAMSGIPKTLAVLLDTLPASRALAFKIGGDAAGLLRPDKIVVYFEGLEDLQGCAERLAARLEGLPAQGIPFTAEIAGDGLLSWGMDPPAQERVLPWQAVKSWRSWIARRLAIALIAAQARTSDAIPAWQFALERLRLEGVDVDRWVPSPTLWRREL